MKKITLLLLSLFSLLFVQCGTSSQFENFVTAKKDKLMEGNKELRFVSFNIPNLMEIEDYFPFKSSNPWRLPSEFEVKDALKTIKELGGKVTRIYVPSVRRLGESKKIVRFVEGPGKFNEKAFRSLDKVLQIANEEGVRLIIPLVDNWWWWGGRAEYAAFRGKQANDFWTDPQIIADFEKTIKFVLERKNSYTGELYKDDKSILGWETGNELDAPLAWQDEIARYIKSLDRHHLVIEGVHSPVIDEEAVSDSNFDVLTTHFYNPIVQATEDILKNKALTRGIKPYFVGEFGMPTVKDVKEILDTAINNGVSGIMIWSLRFHSRTGGFYQHGEGYAGSYRFPGFSSGDRYHEKEVVNLMRKDAFKINGENETPVPVPQAPKLLPIKDVYDISWQGSTGADSYSIERKTSGSEEWKIIADSVSDANVVFRPLYDDTTAILGKGYFYRVLAKNESGVSEPSNVLGPVKVRYKKFVDELIDSTNFVEQSGSFKFLSSQNLYKAKVDDSRLEGSINSYIVYKIPAAMDSIRIEVFLIPTKGEQIPGQCGLDFYASDSLTRFTPLAAKLETYPPLENYYGFYTPAIYTCEEFPANSKFLKIKFNNVVELSRVEIIYSTIQPPDPNIVEVR